MNISTFIVLSALAVVFLTYFLFVTKGMDIYAGRTCQGLKWRTQFPEASKDEIRGFLGFFSSAFAVRSKHVLLLSPQDELLAIY